jgi:hypothetical protein
MPSVQRLEPGALSYFLVRMCPNITVLENGGDLTWLYFYYKKHEESDPTVLLTRTGAYASNLTRFALSLGVKGWSIPLLQDKLLGSFRHWMIDIVS